MGVAKTLTLHNEQFVEENMMSVQRYRITTRFPQHLSSIHIHEKQGKTCLCKRVACQLHNVHACASSAVMLSNLGYKKNQVEGLVGFNLNAGCSLSPAVYQLAGCTSSRTSTSINIREVSGRELATLLWTARSSNRACKCFPTNSVVVLDWTAFSVESLECAIQNFEHLENKDGGSVRFFAEIVVSTATAAAACEDSEEYILVNNTDTCTVAEEEKEQEVLISFSITGSSPCVKGGKRYSCVHTGLSSDTSSGQGGVGGSGGGGDYNNYSTADATFTRRKAEAEKSFLAHLARHTVVAHEHGDVVVCCNFDASLLDFNEHSLQAHGSGNFKGNSSYAAAAEPAPTVLSRALETWEEALGSEYCPGGLDPFWDRMILMQKTR